MKLVNRWTLAAQAPVLLRSELKTMPRGLGERYAPHLAAMEALGPRPHPDEIERILPGYTSVGWCRECLLAELGPEDAWPAQDEDFEQHHPQATELVEVGEGRCALRLCAQCLLKALQLIEP